MSNFDKSKSWIQMNCSLNPKVLSNSKALSNSKVLSKSFYISDSEPLDYDLPSGMECIVYHPLRIDSSKESKSLESSTQETKSQDLGSQETKSQDLGSQETKSQDLGSQDLDNQMKEAIMDFILTQDRTSSGNITELSSESFDRILSTPSIIAVLKKEGKIIGTIVTLIFRVQYRDFKFLSSYTTFLCIETSHREQGLAMILIRAVMKKAYSHYKMQHGYYMTAAPHHPVSTPIKSWYRPINLKKAISAGFTVQTFPSTKGMSGETRQRLMYHIPKPSILPIKVTPQSYKLVCRLLRTDGVYLAPTRSEYTQLCNCFDIYTVGDYGLFMLFPMTTFISDGNQRVRNAQLVLMIGEVMSQVLYAASDYDLLYGWCSGNITEKCVTDAKGLITVSSPYLELYNTRNIIPPEKFNLPLF